MRELLQQKQTATVVAVFLTMALLVTMVAPLGGFTLAEPQNPFQETDIRPIESVDLGVVADGSLGEVIQSAGNSQQSGQSGSDSQPTDQTEDPQQQAQPEQQEDTQNPTEKPDSAPQDPQQPQENGDGEQTDAEEGEVGGEETELDLGLVLTWYKYGREASTVVCDPGSAVGRTIKDTQLDDGKLRYHLEMTGEDGGDCTITEVRFGYLDTVGQRVDESGTVELSLPQGHTEISYGFTVLALHQTQDAEGKAVEQELEFRIAIYYESGLDLDLQLNWTDKDGKHSAVRCMADKSAAFTVKRSWLTQDVLPYTLEMSGESAKNAEFISASWSSDSGQRGELEQSGQWQLEQPRGDETSYTLRVEVRVDERPVIFTYTLNYENNLDLKLAFTWYEGGLTAKTLNCEANESSSLTIKRSQLSGDQLQYDLALSGESADGASLLSAQLSPGSSLNTPSGSVFLSLPQDGNKAKYTLTVKARTGGTDGETVTFTIPITYTGDVQLAMHYEAAVEGVTQQFTVTCDNGKTKQAAMLYDDQLTEDLLPYTLELTGDDAAGLTITEVSCYQSGSGRTISLTQPTGTVKLLLDGKKTGENTITVKAQDSGGSTCQFKINLPYKHQGENTVKIETNLTDGEEIANESELTLTVQAWSENEDGSVKEYILASGDTELVVQLDGKTYRCTGSDGVGRQQYTLIPENPAEGDTNEHVLTIRAVDSEGNWGEKTVTFIGKRAMTGQKIGTATIYVDMGVVGLGTYGPISYDVLDGEPVSYVAAKALWGYEDTTFGAAENSFHWSENYCGYSGSLDQKFYLTRLGTGDNLASRAAVISGSGWNSLGGTQEEQLAAIDSIFGAESELACLWRCICRSDLALSPQASPYSIGEFDFTSGSGWLYEVSGSYPGSAMSEYFLKDGDTLTLRYTLARGEDLGSGSSSFCVTWNGSRFVVHHDLQTDENGIQECRCCGLRKECLHNDAQWQDQEDGTCVKFCDACQKTVGEPTPHKIAVEKKDAENHVLVCENCGNETPEEHDWEKTGSTVSCEHGGDITYQCKKCQEEKQEYQAEPEPHQMADTWYSDRTVHYRECQNCHQKIAETEQSHTYEPDGDDWCCSVCDAYHDDVCGGQLTRTSESTCQLGVYVCSSCGLRFERTEVLSDLHNYGADGYCIHCGEPDPNYSGGEAETPTDPENPTVPELPPEETDPTDPTEPEIQMAAWVNIDPLTAQTEKNRRNHHA